MLKGYKTVIFNLIMLIIAALRIMSPESVLPSDVDVNQWLNGLDALLVLTITLGNMILRAITDSSVFKKTSPAPMPEVKE